MWQTSEPLGCEIWRAQGAKTPLAPTPKHRTETEPVGTLETRTALVPDRTGHRCERVPGSDRNPHNAYPDACRWIFPVETYTMRSRSRFNFVLGLVGNG